jgi:hypothetical protein
MEDETTTTPEPEEERSVTFAGVLQVRALGEGDAESLMDLCRKRALSPEVFDEFPPAFFLGEISSNRWDSFETRMMPSTLRNYATEAGQGVSVLRNHDVYSDPVGQSLTGRFIQGSGNGVARVESDFYLLTDPETAPYVRKLRAGVVRGQSVGFYGGEWNCTICGRDMQQWMSRDGCPHLLGMMYTPESKNSEPVMARAEIENAHLAEYSCVYRGSTPGAMVKKARAFAEEGLLDTRQRELVQVRYRLHLPEPTRIYTGAELEAGTREEKPMAEKTPGAASEGPEMEQRLTGILARLRGHGMAENEADPAEWITGQMQRLTQLRALEETLKGARDGEEKPAETLTRLCNVVAVIGEHRAQDEPYGAAATRLMQQAADGRAYRTHLIDAALAEGVRALGDKFAADVNRKSLEASTLEVIKVRHDEWKLIGDKQFHGGRVTQDGEQREPVQAERRAPIGAYAA